MRSGRLVTLQLLDAECARMQASEQQPEQQKIIPLYMTPGRSRLCLAGLRGRL